MTASTHSSDERPPANANERLARPGPHHARLASLVGEWHVRLKVWPEAGATPIESSDLTAHREWLIDGRFMQERTQGTLGGAPFQRIGLLTYHALLQRFEYVTLDNLDTGFMRAESVCDAEKDVTLYGSFVQAGYGQDIVGRVVKLKYVWKLGDEQGNSMLMFVTPPATPEFLLAEFAYTRRD